jgi:hypothetical protein
LNDASKKKMKEKLHFDAAINTDKRDYMEKYNGQQQYE